METFALRPTIYFGEDTLSALGALAGRRVFLVTDEFLARKSGLLERVTARLKGGEVEIFDRVTPDPSLKLVAEGVRALRDFRPDAVLAFGGGSPMDCAKALRHFSGLGGLPFWCVPTTAGTGSEVTSFAVLTDTDKGVKYPLVDDALLPDAAVLDASLLAGVPGPVTADTGMDVLTHASEAYVARKANPFTDALAERAFATAFRRVRAAREGDQGARRDMLMASCLAGIAFNAAGLGVNHALAHALGGRYHVPHGRLNAMLMPHVIRFNAGAAPSAPFGAPPPTGGGKGHDGPGAEQAAAKYARLAGLCGLSGSARALASALDRLRQGMGMPAKLTDCGVERATVLADLEALSAAALADVCAPGNPRPATAEELAALIKELV